MNIYESERKGEQMFLNFSSRGMFRDMDSIQSSGRSVKMQHLINHQSHYYYSSSNLRRENKKKYKSCSSFQTDSQSTPLFPAAPRNWCILSFLLSLFSTLLFLFLYLRWSFSSCIISNTYQIQKHTIMA